MCEPVRESYEMKNKDGEQHAISVMLEALERHVSRAKQNPNSEENIKEGQIAMVRCARYVLERVGG